MPVLTTQAPKSHDAAYYVFLDESSTVHVHGRLARVHAVTTGNSIKFDGLFKFDGPSNSTAREEPSNLK